MNKKSKPPQLEVPDDVIVHHIVKDYRRMFFSFDKMREYAKKMEARVKKLEEKNAELTAEFCIKGKIHQYRLALQQHQEICKKYKAEIKALKKINEKLSLENKYLRAATENEETEPIKSEE